MCRLVSQSVILLGYRHMNLTRNRKAYVKTHKKLTSIFMEPVLGYSWLQKSLFKLAYHIFYLEASCDEEIERNLELDGFT